METEVRQKSPIWMKYAVRIFFALIAVVFWYFTNNGTFEALLIPVGILFGGFFATPSGNYQQGN